jgi:SAM-dependent methyltransferase
MTPVTCNLCGADDATVKFPAGVAQVNQIVVCNRCSLMYASPRATEPDHVQIEQYDPDYVSPVPLSGDPRHSKEVLQVRDYASTRRFLAARYPKRGRLLEVGSSFGYLLASFREDGWQVLGVEPNAGLNRHAQRELKLDVVSAILPEANIESSSMDVVLMMHVIEHVPDPAATLEEIFRILRPGGTLVMETPIYDSLMFKLLGRRERSVSCEGHIYFFTSRTLAQISAKAGFEVLRADRVGRSMNLSRLFYNIGVMSKSGAIQVVLNKAARSLHLDRLSFSLNVRDMERIYLGKPSSSPGPGTP